jgi:hypothetical protein
VALDGDHRHLDPAGGAGGGGGLSISGETLNIMTLGGLSLAVGILVDDATVTIENINWHLEHGKGVREAILDGAQQIVARLSSPAVHLHRLCADVLPAGRGGLPLRADGQGGGLRHDRQLRAQPHAGAHHGQLPAARPCHPHTADVMASHDALKGREPHMHPLRRFQHGFEVRLKSCAAGMWGRSASRSPASARW